MPENDAEAFVKTVFKDDSFRQALENRLDLTEDLDFNSEELRDRTAETITGFAAKYDYEFTAEEGFEAFRP